MDTISACETCGCDVDDLRHQWARGACFGLRASAAGMYHSRIRAAYWDGKNGIGESVASGLYFYTLTAGDFSATRKMLIQK